MSKNHLIYEGEEHFFKELFNNSDDLIKLYGALSGISDFNSEKFFYHSIGSTIWFGVEGDSTYIVDAYNCSIFDTIFLSNSLSLDRIYEHVKNNYTMYSDTYPDFHLTQYTFLYLGNCNMPDRFELKFSNYSNNSNINVMVHFFNFNPGHNTAVVGKCNRLYEYLFFVNKTHLYHHSHYSSSLAISCAINDCIENNILLDKFVNGSCLAEDFFATDYDNDAYNIATSVHDKNNSYSTSSGDKRAYDISEVIHSLIEAGVSKDCIITHLQKVYSIDKYTAIDYYQRFCF